MKELFDFILKYMPCPEFFILVTQVVLIGLINIRGGKCVTAKGYFFPSVIRKGWTESVPVEKVEGEQAQKQGRSSIRTGIFLFYLVFIGYWRHLSAKS